MLDLLTRSTPVSLADVNQMWLIRPGHTEKVSSRPRHVNFNHHFKHENQTGHARKAFSWQQRYPLHLLWWGSGFSSILKVVSDTFCLEVAMPSSYGTVNYRQHATVMVSGFVLASGLLDLTVNPWNATEHIVTGEPGAAKSQHPLPLLQICCTISFCSLFKYKLSNGNNAYLCHPVHQKISGRNDLKNY